MTTPKRERFVDFRGGVNTKSSPYLVDQKEARDARNVVSTTRGSVRKRDGCETFGSLGSTGSTLFAATALDPAVLICINGGNIVAVDSGGSSTDIDGGIGMSSNDFAVVQAPTQGGQGPVYLCNGADAPIQWTGTGNVALWTATAGTGPGVYRVTLPVPKHMIVHDNRLFMANVTGAGTADGASTLVWSDIGAPRSFDQDNVTMFDPNDGDEITGLGKVGPYLLVFKRHKTFLVSDSTTSENRRISASVGCVAPRSIAESPQGTYFLTADRGVYLTNGSSVKAVSENLAPTLDSVVSSWRDNSAGVFYNEHYYLSVSTQGARLDLTLDLDTTLGSWWLHSFAANQWAICDFATADALFAANSETAKISRCFVPGATQDNGANFTAYWKGPWQTEGLPDYRKRLRQLHLDGIGPFDVYLATDFGPDETLAKASVCSTATGTLFGGTLTFAGAGVYGDVIPTQEDRAHTLGVARAFSVIFTAATSTMMEIDSYTMKTIMRNNWV
jgi:hypothetical protein